MLKRLFIGVHRLVVFPKYFVVSGSQVLTVNACVSVSETCVHRLMVYPKDFVVFGRQRLTVSACVSLFATCSAADWRSFLYR